MVKLRGPQRPSLRLQPFCSLATSAVPSATAGAAAYGVGAGFFGGTSVTFAKLCFLMFAETLRDGGENAFVQPVGFLWASLAFLGELALVYCLFVGVARHEAAVVVPAYYSLMTVTASVQGLTLFDLLRKFASAGAAAARQGQPW